MSPIDEETVRERQSRVARAGGKWEEYVKLYLEEKLQGTDIEIIYGKYEKQVQQQYPEVWKVLAIPLVGRRFTWGDYDLIAVKDNLPIAVISCKVSFHNRLTETLFWAVLVRMLTNSVRFVLATADGGAKTGKPVWKSEFGSLSEPTKNRLLCETYLDGVYVENVPEFCEHIKTDENGIPVEGTELGGILRPLHELPEDLKRWAGDLKFLSVKKGGLEGFF